MESIDQTLHWKELKGPFYYLLQFLENIIPMNSTKSLSLQGIKSVHDLMQDNKPKTVDTLMAEFKLPGNPILSVHVLYTFYPKIPFPLSRYQWNLPNI